MTLAEQTPILTDRRMDLNLNKVTVVRPGWTLRRDGDRHRRRLLLVLRRTGAGGDGEPRCRNWTRFASPSRKGPPTANELGPFRQQVAELEGRLESLKAVLPEQKDVADLLRRIETLAPAVEPGDSGIQAGAVGYQAASCGMAYRAPTRRHVSQPGGVLRSRE